MKHDFLGRSGEKFPWVTEHLKKVVLFDLFFRIEFVFHFFKAIFDTTFSPLQSFFGKWNRDLWKG